MMTYQMGNWDAALEKITSSISKFLGVSRASIWAYNEEKHSIVSEKLYMKAGNKFEAGTELFGKDFPRYFKAVLAEENIVAENAHTHPATSEFSEIYLKPLNIESMLDVPIFNQGKIFG